MSSSTFRFFTRSSILLLVIVLSVACGHKTQVKAPVLKKPPSPAAAKTKPTQNQEKPPAPSAPSAATQEEKSAGLEPSAAKPPDAPMDTAVGPLIRIGLTTDAMEVRISSSAEYSVIEKIAEASRQEARGEMQLRVETESGEGPAIYRVQVAAYSSPELALALKKKLSDTFAQPVLIHLNAAATLNHVWMGEFVSKEQAQSYARNLAQSGYPGAFVVKDAGKDVAGGPILALRGPGNLFRLSKVGFLFQSSSRTDFLRIDGKPYRGVFEINLNAGGRITVVNQLGMEEYLLGVVPAELSPSSYPEFAALAAQSIAARTYALRKLGRKSFEGFDLSDDTRSQVYVGVNGEQEASNKAVRQTSGLAIYFKDQLIDAMYMSTCGGRTEDFSDVFESAAVPYLKSVFCAVESGPEKGEMVLQGKHRLDRILLSDDGSVANRNIEFAQILGLAADVPDLTAQYLEQPAETREISQWIGTAGKIAQRTVPAAPAKMPDIRTRAGFLQYAAEVFFGAADIKRKMSPRDVDYYMGNLGDGKIVPDASRPAISYMIQNGLWQPYPDNTVRPDDPIRRVDALFLLLRWLESSRPEILRKGTFVPSSTGQSNTVSERSVQVKWGNRTQEFSFAPNPILFRVDQSRTIPVNDLKIIGNEKLRFHLSAEGAIDLLEIELSPAGAASDRYSPVATWDTTLTRSAVADKIRGMAGSIGEFRDLKPHRIGNSGRVVQIQVIGSRSSAVLNGYKVRNALGLRDTLFTLTREYNPDGTIASFVFHGRGYGHGVGLCQTGAFGMARAGRGYEEILKTYYQGIEIRKAY